MMRCGSMIQCKGHVLCAGQVFVYIYFKHFVSVLRLNIEQKCTKIHKIGFGTIIVMFTVLAPYLHLLISVIFMSGRWVCMHIVPKNDALNALYDCKRLYSKPLFCLKLIWKGIH